MLIKNARTNDKVEVRYYDQPSVKCWQWNPFHVSLPAVISKSENSSHKRFNLPLPTDAGRTPLLSTLWVKSHFHGGNSAFRRPRITKLINAGIGILKIHPNSEASYIGEKDITTMLKNALLKKIHKTLTSSPSLPSPFLTFCTILPTSFGGKGPHLRRWLVAQSLHQTVS